MIVPVKITLLVLLCTSGTWARVSRLTLAEENGYSQSVSVEEVQEQVRALRCADEEFWSVHF